MTSPHRQAHRRTVRGPSRTRNAGASRLEACVATVVLSAVIAMALPSLRAVQAQADITVLERLAGNMRAAADLFHLRCQTAMATTASEGCTRLSFGETQITGLNYFPSADADGIGKVAGVVDSDGKPRLFAMREIRINGARGVSVSLPDTENKACQLEYLEAAEPGQRPTIALNPSTCH